MNAVKMKSGIYWVCPAVWFGTGIVFAVLDANLTTDHFLPFSAFIPFAVLGSLPVFRMMLTEFIIKDGRFIAREKGFWEHENIPLSQITRVKSEYPSFIKRLLTGLPEKITRVEYGTYGEAKIPGFDPQFNQQLLEHQKQNAAT